MMMTRRDLDIINFLEEYRVATTSTIRCEFFPSLKTCQVRLRKLYDNCKVKRARLTMNNDYMYYVNKPKNTIHYLLNTEFYRKLKENANILNYVIEKEVGKIRPDAIFAYEDNGKQKLGVLEIEISHKGFDYEKYENFYKTGTYKETLKVMPTVYVVCKNAKLPQNTQIKYITIKPDMSDFRL